MSDNSLSSPTHALATGALMGAASKAGLTLVPVMDDEGNYTNRFEVTGIVAPLVGNLRVFITVDPPEEPE